MVRISVRVTDRVRIRVMARVSDSLCGVVKKQGDPG